MELNVTFIIQIVHFYIALCIVDLVFLRTAVAYIDAEDRKKAALDRQLQGQQARVTECHEHNLQDWRVLRRRLQAECPSVLPLTRAHMVHVARDVGVCVIAPDEAARVADELRQALTERVLHD